MKKTVLVLVSGVLLGSPQPPGAMVLTVAGGGVGDGGPAVSASLGALGNIAIDRSGDLLVADRGQSRIRQIRRTIGMIDTVAELEPKRGAAFLAIGPSGQLLFNLPYQVQQLDLVTGLRRGFAGSGEINWSRGEVPFGRGAARTALGRPAGIAVSPAGTVFVADPDRNQIVQVDLAGVLTRTFQMDPALPARGSQTLETVRDVATDTAGRLHFSDQRRSQIFRVESSRAIAVAGTGMRRQKFPREGSGVRPQEGDGGPAISAPLDTPTQIAFGPDGSFLFGEGHGSLRKVDREGRISTIHGPEISRAEISGVAISPGGEVIFASNADTTVGQVFRLVEGHAELLAGSGVAHCCGDGAPSTSAPLSKPWGIAVAPDGDLLIADRANDRIRRVSARTGRISTQAGGGLFALPGSRHVLFRPVRSAPPPGRIPASFFEVLSPRFVAADLAGNVYFSSEEGPVYRVGSKDGTLTALGAGRNSDPKANAPAGFRGIGGIAVDASGNVIVAAEHRIFRVTPSGAIGLIAGTGREGFFGDDGYATLAELSRPAWPVVDARGTITFVDAGNNRIRAIGLSQKITTVAGNGQGWTSGEGPAVRESIGAPTGLSIETTGDFLYATGDNRIFRLSTRDGMLRVLAGREPSTERPSPDGPLAAISNLGGPLAIALDAKGTIHFSEPEYDRIRTIRPRS